MSVFGLLKRVRILDEVIIAFGGVPGVDTKVVLKPLKENYHYTISVRHGSDWLAQPRIPLDVHKTYEGPKKEYDPLGKGSFDMKTLASRLMQNATLDMNEIDLSAPLWRNRDMISFDERLRELFVSKELNITLDFLKKFAPVPASQLKSGFGIGMRMESEAPGIIVKADSKAYSLALPGFKGFEKNLDGTLEFESFVEKEEDEGEDLQEQ